MTYTPGKLGIAKSSLIGAYSVNNMSNHTGQEIRSEMLAFHKISSRMLLILQMMDLRKVFSSTRSWRVEVKVLNYEVKRSRDQYLSVREGKLHWLSLANKVSCRIRAFHQSSYMGLPPYPRWKLNRTTSKWAWGVFFFHRSWHLSLKSSAVNQLSSDWRQEFRIMVARSHSLIRITDHSD